MSSAARCRACGANIAIAYRGVMEPSTVPILSPWIPGERICEDCGFQVFLALARALIARSKRTVEQDLELVNRARFLAGQLAVVGALPRRRDYRGSVPLEVATWVH